MTHNHSSNVYNFHQFDMSKIKPGSIILVLGARGTGKTTMILELMYHIRHYPMGLMMVGTMDTADQYAKHFPSILIYEGWNPEAITKLMQDQEKRMMKLRRKGLDVTRIPHNFIILDDLLFDFKKVNNDPNMKRLFLNGRHFHTTIIIAAQYAMQITKENRAQVDYVFATYQKTQKYRDQIFEHFDVGFEDSVSFHAIMTYLTKEYRVMVLDTRSNLSPAIEDSVYFVKAKLNRIFLMGCKALWRFQRKYYDPMHGAVGIENRNKNLLVKRPRNRRITIRRIERIKHKVRSAQDRDKVF